MNIEGFITTDLIRLKENVSDRKAAIRKLGQCLLEKGYIKPAYIENVLKREVNFPTGIKLLKNGIAIPHASPEKTVVKNGIAILQLADSVVFHRMENSDETVAVNLIFLLALKESNQHLTMLQKLFAMLQEESCIDVLLNSSNEEEIKNLMLSKLKDKSEEERV
ncbi:PTS sugar transporter subunit IIA [Anaerosinus massiliensis]|uniref:PTS sugar transporter subunit IIA n=1 Tax=Massilibacillus massiliensis TaxID=1806837 RepID=UPI0018FE2952|nr:PTS sugar transporter subunit IIA [Massilibacillus massiliensis]